MEIFPLTIRFAGAKPFQVESLTSRKAADQLGVNPQKFHRLVAAYDVHPVFEAEGIRGVKLWNPLDIAALGRRIEADAVAS